MIMYIYLIKNNFLYIISKKSKKSDSYYNLMNYFVHLRVSDDKKSGQMSV